MIYLARATDRLYKVGRSRDPVRRLTSLQTACPVPLVLAHLIPANDGGAAEAHLKRRLADRRAGGEWFDLDPGRLAEVRSVAYLLVTHGRGAGACHPIPPGQSVCLRSFRAGSREVSLTRCDPAEAIARLGPAALSRLAAGLWARAGFCHYRQFRTEITPCPP